MFSFVILHYKNLNDTQECIKSIKKYCNNYNYSIVVVVNSAKSKKEIDALKKIADDVVVSKENLGFAKGNNIGCHYAIEKYKPVFLCVINNDTLITSSAFLETIKKEYEKYHFDMMGPKILTSNGESVNPFPVYKKTTEIKKAIRKAKVLISIYNNSVLRVLLNNYIKLKGRLIKRTPITNGNETKTGVALHGCAIIFSNKYYEKYNDIFFDDTFLFHEEEFLYYRMKKDNLISLYSSELEIFHKEGSSLDNQFKDQDYKKIIFKNKYIIDSLEKLLKIM